MTYIPAFTISLLPVLYTVCTTCSVGLGLFESCTRTCESDVLTAYIRAFVILEAIDLQIVAPKAESRLPTVGREHQPDIGHEERSFARVRPATSYSYFALILLSIAQPTKRADAAQVQYFFLPTNACGCHRTEKDTSKNLLCDLLWSNIDK